MDKDCILINLNPGSKEKSELLENWRRVNVALTRAKKKLIIVGSINELRKVKGLESLLDLILENKWVDFSLTWQ